MHRDLKPENLLVQDSSDSNRIDVKLTDFGFATSFKKGEMQDLTLGSPLYKSPELVREEKYDNRVDIWSTGVITYILLCGKPPFIENNKTDIDGIYEAI